MTVCPGRLSCALATLLAITATTACGDDSPAPFHLSGEAGKRAPPSQADSGQTQPVVHVVDAGENAVVSAWSWICCNNGNRGTFTLDQVGMRIAGTFHDEAVNTGGTLSGTLTASRMDFVRSVDGGQQHFTIDLSPDGTHGDGTISGSFLSGATDVHVDLIE